MPNAELVNSKYYLNIRSGYMAPVTLHCSLGDRGESITFVILDGTGEMNLDGTIVSVHGTRKDGANFGPFSCTPNGNTVTFELQSSMTAVEGAAIAELTITENETTIGTCNFGIMVENSAFPNGVTYDTDPSVYQDILAYVQSIPSQITSEYSTKLNAEIKTRQDADYSETSARIAGDSANSTAINTQAARIDNLIAPTTVEGELIDIRVDSNGKTHASAGAAVRTFEEETEDAVNELRKLSPLSFTIPYGINIDNYTWSALPAGSYYIVYPVKPGDLFEVRAVRSSRASYLFALKSLTGYSTTNHAVDMCAAPYSTVIRYYNYRLIVPQDCNYLVNAGIMSGVNYSPNVAHLNGYDLISDTSENLYPVVLKNRVLDQVYGTDLLDWDDIVTKYGYVLDDQGQPIQNQYTAEYSYTDYYSVGLGDTVYYGCSQGSTLNALCVYDADKNFLYYVRNDSFGAYNHTIKNSAAAYIRYNVLKPEASLTHNLHNYLYIKKASSGDSDIDGSTYTVTTAAQLKSVLDTIHTSGLENCKVFVEPGTYDLVSAFGTSYLDNISQSTNRGIGLFLGNNTHLIFAEGAYVKFLYSGNNAATAEYFSPFNITGSCIIENANIEVTNARYCVHEDLPTSATSIPSSYTIKYINCVMKHNGNTGAYTGTVCIGAGTMPNSLSIIEGGKYTCGTQFPRAISYHNYDTASYGDYPSKIILHNVWINNALRLGVFADSKVEVEISGCYIPNGIFDGDSTYFTITEWNNSFSS